MVEYRPFKPRVEGSSPSDPIGEYYEQLYCWPIQGTKISRGNS